MKSVVAVDLFCGIGGLTSGLKASGIDVVAGIDIDSSCKYAYEENNGAKFIAADVSEISGEFVSNLYPENSVRILAGCAPCQPYSSIRNGKKATTVEEKQLKAFIRLIQETVPDIVTMENVVNLQRRQIYKEFLVALGSLHYNIWERSVNAADYGVPQKRRRLVLLASRIGSISMIPATHTKESYVSVEQTIKRLVPLRAGHTSKLDPMHKARDLSDLNLKRIKASKPNGTWMDWDEHLRLKCHLKESGKSFKAVYGRMSWNKPAPTITTKFHNIGSGRFGHPSQNRSLTPREAALLQTFPVDYKFVEEGEPVLFEKMGRWIGNAVPVKLAENIGLSIVKCIADNLITKEEMER